MREGEKKAMARRLRKKLTPAEALMWWRLRRDYEPWLFRRQHPVGPYIADFACVEARLIVEIDGATHATPEAVAYDQQRTACLEREGWRVIRFWNGDVETNREGVRDAVFFAIDEQLAWMQRPKS